MRKILQFPLLGTAFLSPLVAVFALSCTGSQGDEDENELGPDAGSNRDPTPAADAGSSPDAKSPPPDSAPLPDSGPQPDAGPQPVSCIPLPLNDSTMRIDGSLSQNSPFWTVPINYDCDESGTTAFGQPYYQAFVFCNTGPARNFDFLAMTSYVDPFGTPFGSLSDPTLFLFNGDELPADPTTCVAADNNSANTYPTQTIPLINGIGVPNQAVFTVVVSSHVAGDTGTFELWVALDD